MGQWLRLADSMPFHLEFEQWVPFPIEPVFAFFSNPENLPRIMPVASATKIVRLTRTPPPPPADQPPHAATDHAAGVGSIIVTSFRIFPFLPLRAHWIARITEFEWNHHFADVQDKGPFKVWHHRHEFTAEKRDRVEGTFIRDGIDYEVGFGFVGKIANHFFVRPQMQSTFAARRKALPELLS